MVRLKFILTLLAGSIICQLFAQEDEFDKILNQTVENKE